MSTVDPGVTPSPPPEHVGRFKIKRLLGTGSMGTVFLAEDPVIHRDVAIKTLNVNLPPQEARVFEESFLNEARAAGRLNHAHIVTVYDAGRIDGVSYIAMEHLKGVELKELIARGEHFTMRQVAEIFIRVADALQYAHDHGIVHRDVKPANIFLTTKTNPKVLDFGIAQAATSFSGSFIGNPFGKNLVGTPNYMSPELIMGRPLDGRSDVFSLGVVMYEVLTGQLPFKGSTFDDLTHAICTVHPTPPQDINAEVPLAISRIVAKSLAKNPNDRYQHAREMADDLRRYVATVRVKQIMSASGAAPDAAEDQNKHSTTKLVVMGLAAIIAVSLAAAAWFISHDEDAPQVAAVAPTVGAPVAVAPEVVPPPPAEPAALATTAPPPATAPINKEVPAKPAREAPPKRLAPVKEADQNTAAPLATEPGTLALAISPWGEVLVDGMPRGVSPPLSALQLSPGKHTIEIRNGDFEPHRAVVEITSNESTRLRHKF